MTTINEKPPKFRAQLVQCSSIATAVAKRTTEKVTNADVKAVARHLGIEWKEDDKAHEHFFPLLQAEVIYDALLRKVRKDQAARASATTDPATPPSGGNDAPAEKTKDQIVEEMFGPSEPVEYRENPKLKPIKRKTSALDTARIIAEAHTEALVAALNLRGYKVQLISDNTIR